jgi:hypothetical protein
MREWQKELIGLGVGTGVVHVLMAAALVAMVLFAFGGSAQ